MHRLLGALAVLAVTFSLSATPHLTSVSPSVGFLYGGTHVTLLGDDLVGAFVHCTDQCQSPGVCPVSVLFGTTPAEVQYALPDRIVVIAPAHAPGTVSVTLKVTNRPTVTLDNAFTYDANAVVSAIDYARYLLPVYARDTSGGYGSRWASEWTVLNASSETLRIGGPFCGAISPCFPSTWAPGEYAQRAFYPGSYNGVFINVPKPLDHDVAQELRVRDVSRESEGWGTELPLVRTTEFRPAMYLIDVPTDPRYRATLRVYSDRSTNVRIRVVDQDAGPDPAPLDESVHALEDPGFEPEFRPRYLQLDPLTAAVRAAANGHPVRVEVFVEDDSIIDPPPSIWAFVSITNNDTQQVTTITPRR